MFCIRIHLNMQLKSVRSHIVTSSLGHVRVSTEQLWNVTFLSSGQGGMQIVQSPHTRVNNGASVASVYSSLQGEVMGGSQQ